MKKKFEVIVKDCYNYISPKVIMNITYPTLEKALEFLRVTMLDIYEDDVDFVTECMGKLVSNYDNKTHTYYTDDGGNLTYSIKITKKKKKG